MNLADKILEKAKVPEKVLEIPEWEMTVLLKGLSVDEVQTIRKASNGEQEAVAVLTVIAGLYDPETHKPIFQPAHRDALSAGSSTIIARLASEIAELNGLTPGSLKVAEKN